MFSNRQQPKGKRIVEDLADELVMKRYLFDWCKERPGQIVQSLPPEQRAALAKLTSDDLKDARWPRPDGLNLEAPVRTKQDWK
jgi:hypothetical protein